MDGHIIVEIWRVTIKNHLHTMPKKEVCDLPAKLSMKFAEWKFVSKSRMPHPGKRTGIIQSSNAHFYLKPHSTIPDLANTCLLP